LGETKAVMLSTTVPAAQQHLQGLVTRRTVSADPKNPVAYFGHVADAVRANRDFDRLRCERWTVWEVTL
jgi:hypothetical protein